MERVTERRVLIWLAVLGGAAAVVWIANLLSTQWMLNRITEDGHPDYKTLYLLDFLNRVPLRVASAWVAWDLARVRGTAVGVAAGVVGLFSGVVGLVFVLGLRVLVERQAGDIRA
jgi:hypothetical protein